MADLGNGISSTPLSGSMAGSGGGIPTKTTRPKVLLRHDISDEELELLANGRRDGLSEAMWAFIGAAIGTISPFFRNLASAYGENSVPMPWLDLIEVIICIVSIVLAGVCGFLQKRQTKVVCTLRDKIQNRKRS